MANISYIPWYNSRAVQASLIATGSFMCIIVLIWICHRRRVVSVPITRGNDKKCVLEDDIESCAPTEDSRLLGKWDRDLRYGQHDQTVGVTLLAILSPGLNVVLHTTRGPKPIVLSFSGNEVRWQAQQNAQKRYKLSLKDVVFVEQGKHTANFAKSSEAPDCCCFSLVTQKTTLDLETSDKDDRDALVNAFQVKIEDMTLKHLSK